MQERFEFSGDEDARWRLDDRTKAIGRQGIAAARLRLEHIKNADAMHQAA